MIVSTDKAFALVNVHMIEVQDDESRVFEQCIICSASELTAEAYEREAVLEGLVPRSSVLLDLMSALAITYTVERRGHINVVWLVRRFNVFEECYLHNSSICFSYQSAF